MCMISEALELGVKCGRVSYIWCVCVVSHGNGWLGAVMEVVVRMDAVQS